MEEKLLEIYCLKPDNTLENLVKYFNIQYPDIRVTIKYGCTDENSITEADAIRILNTELMSGNGPDLMIMDGLSPGTYYKQEMLEDLAAMLETDKAGDKMLTNIVSAYADGQVQYAVPAGFKVYGIVGKEAVVDVFADIDQLLNVLEELDADFVVADYNFSECVKALYIQNIPDCYNLDGSLDGERLSDFFIKIKRLHDLSGNSFDSDNEPAEIAAVQDGGFMESDIEWIYYDEVPFVAAPYTNTDSFAAVNYLVKKEGYAQKYVSQNESMVYRDRLVMSVCKDSDKVEEAGKFISYVLNDGQEIIAYDLSMLPIKKEQLKKLQINENQLRQESGKGTGVYYISETSFNDDPQAFKVYGLCIEEAEYKELLDNLDEAVRLDDQFFSIQEQILKELNSYIAGKKGLDEAVNDVINKVTLQNME